MSFLFVPGSTDFSERILHGSSKYQLNIRKILPFFSKISWQHAVLDPSPSHPWVFKYSLLPYRRISYYYSTSCPSNRLPFVTLLVSLFIFEQALLTPSKWLHLNQQVQVHIGKLPILPKKKSPKKQKSKTLSPS